VDSIDRQFRAKLENDRRIANLETLVSEIPPLRDHKMALLRKFNVFLHDFDFKGDRSALRLESERFGLRVRKLDEERNN